MLNEKQELLLHRFIETFGYPDTTGSLYFCIRSNGMRGGNFPPGQPIFYEEVLKFLYEMKKEELLSVYDPRFDSYDGPCGLEPGSKAGNPHHPWQVIFDSDEATDWIEKRRS